MEKLSSFSTYMLLQIQIASSYVLSLALSTFTQILPTFIRKSSAQKMDSSFLASQLPFPFHLPL